jgi:hypothetical protein
MDTFNYSLRSMQQQPENLKVSRIYRTVAQYVVYVCGNGINTYQTTGELKALIKGGMNGEAFWRKIIE